MWTKPSTMLKHKTSSSRLTSIPLPTSHLDSEASAQLEEWCVHVRLVLGPRPCVALAHTTPDRAQDQVWRSRQSDERASERELAVDVQRLVETVTAKDREASGRAEQAGELDDGLVGHRRAAAVQHVNGVVAAEELPGLGREGGAAREAWVGRVVLGQRLREGLSAGPRLEALRLRGHGW